MSVRKYTKLPKTLGRKVKRLRKLLNLTQEDLAEKVGVSAIYIGYIEQGRNIPSIEILEKIAKHLKVKSKELLP